jgi:hypothetical protein
VDPAADSTKTPLANSRGNTAGRIVHDERGNAVWDWLKDTARIAIDSTSRLLRKLEVPELKMEDTQNQELRLESDRDPGGGYDPYGGSGPTSGRGDGSSNVGRTGTGSPGGRHPNERRGGHDPYDGSGPSAGRAGARNGGGYDPYGRSSGQSSGSNKNSGGGYDPYGKGVTSKPPRKP